MSKIVLTCGHEVEDFAHAYNIMSKCYDRYANNAISYEIVCGPCQDRHRQDGTIFDTEQEADTWVNKNRRLF